jgi:hypothetical protein
MVHHEVWLHRPWACTLWDTEWPRRAGVCCQVCQWCHLWRTACQQHLSQGLLLRYVHYMPIRPPANTLALVLCAEPSCRW